MHEVRLPFPLLFIHSQNVGSVQKPSRGSAPLGAHGVFPSFCVHIYAGELVPGAELGGNFSQRVRALRPAGLPALSAGEKEVTAQAEATRD